MDIVGLDIGGTKCAVVRATANGEVVERVESPTGAAAETVDWMIREVERMIPACGSAPVVGISCGGPLDPQRGLILSPPNLPGWNCVPIVRMVEERTGCRAWIMNDANAGALAEWWFGAARGLDNVVFLTAGTGMGGGLILDGRLYEGASGNAGEIGHMRLAPDGPVGYSKAGSFEGFCSGGGIAQMARQRARETGSRAAFNAGRIETITARDVARAAEEGDADAIELLHEAGRWLGRALAVIVDLLNPQCIVLGSLYVRCEKFLAPGMREPLALEALPQSIGDCRIVPAQLGIRIGDLAAVSVALYRQGACPNPAPRTEQP